MFANLAAGTAIVGVTRPAVAATGWSQNARGTRGVIGAGIAAAAAGRIKPLTHALMAQLASALGAAPGVWHILAEI